MVELVESCGTFTPLVRSFHFNRAVLLIHSCVHFTPIIRSSLSTHAVLCFRRQLFSKVFCRLKLQFQMVWNNSFLRLKLLVSLLETFSFPIWNLCFPRMKLILCLHPRISLSLSVYFRSYFFPFSRHFPMNVPCLPAIICSPKSDNTLTCFSYYHLIVTLTPLINNRLT